MVIPWTEIEGFHNVRKYALAMPEILAGNSTVCYRAKVKLHGMNMGVQKHTDGKIVPQSRTIELSTSNDSAGFAKWVDGNGYLFDTMGSIIYGEWCGPGVQQGVAVSQIPNRIFALFAVRGVDKDMTGVVSTNDSLVVEPEILSIFAKDVPGAYVLPWFSINGDMVEISIDWSAPDSELQNKISIINEWVISVEKNDPWVQETFGVSGTGEGLVFYPVSKEHLGYVNFCNLTFKAKGEAHRVVKTKTPVQLNAEVAASSEAFAGMVLTIARLEQGAKTVSGDNSLTYNNRFIKAFMDWIVKDVQKETTDELEASGLEWKQVQKSVADKARAWYLSQIKR